MLSMGYPKTIKRFTAQEYYNLERDATYRSEFYDGEIFAMAGATRPHSVIVLNAASGLHQRLKGKPCTVHDPNLRIKVLPTGLRAYPDVSVFCDPPQRDPEDPEGQTYTNPTVLVEVLSSSTEAFDRGTKWFSYRQIESLRNYLLISQSDPRVEIFERQADGSWLNRFVNQLDGTLTLNVLQIDLPLREIYDRVNFSEDDDDLPNDAAYSAPKY